MYRKVVKRTLDILVAALLLLVALPFLIVVFIIMAIQKKGQIFFIQERPGRGERIFRIIKLKTMNDKKDDSGKLLPDKMRLTRAGQIIRKLSIDELPQLFNVLKGDMSLVGPRPLLFRYLPLYSDVQRRRHEVWPGITGLAQVSGRNSISWTEKFKHDVYYVDNLSFLLDVKILLLTLKKVLVSEGVNQSEERPMEPFNGKN